MSEIDNIINQIAKSFDEKYPTIHAACPPPNIESGGDCWNPNGPPTPLRMIAYEDMVDVVN